jgi:outer membrane protein TolC
MILKNSFVTTKRLTFMLLFLITFTAVGAAQITATSADTLPVLTVERAIRTALERNRELMLAGLELDGAKARVREAWGGVYPKLDVTASYARNLTVPSSFLPAIIFDPDASPDDLLPVRFGADNVWALQLTAEQPLFEAGVFIGVGAADRYRRLQTEIVRGEAQEIATRVRTIYYDVLLADAALRVSQKSLARVEQTLHETMAMHQAGLASEYDVLRLQVEKSNLEPSLRRARDAVAASKRSLAIELGLEPTDRIRVEGSLSAFDLNTLALSEHRPAADFAGSNGQATAINATLTQALESRSDLRQLELTRALRKAELRAEQAEYLPKVSLFGSYTINAQDNGDPRFFGRQRAYGRQVGVQVTMPLFSGFQRPARVEQKEAQLHSAETQAKLARALAEHELTTLSDQHAEAIARAQAQRLTVEQAQRGYQIASAQYREGISGHLEVTDAELALRQSEFNYAQAVYDYLVARAKLDRATGSVQFVDDGAWAPLNIVGIR